MRQAELGPLAGAETPAVRSKGAEANMLVSNAYRQEATKMAVKSAPASLQMVRSPSTSRSTPDAGDELRIFQNEIQEHETGWRASAHGRAGHITWPPETEPAGRFTIFFSSGRI